MTYQEKKIDKTEDKGIRFALFEKANFEYAGTRDVEYNPTEENTKVLQKIIGNFQSLHLICGNNKNIMCIENNELLTKNNLKLLTPNML